jgi:hypothetical protein
VSSKHVADTRRGHRDPELLQLADDAEIAPARVLASETKHECNDLGIERVGCDLLRPREGPVPANELTVLAHQRCWGDEEGGPTLTRKKSSECREHGAIGRGEPRSLHLATKHHELMTQHRDLDVLLIWAWTDPNEAKQLSNEQEGH